MKFHVSYAFLLLPIVCSRWMVIAMPLARRLIDLSHTLDRRTPIFPGGVKFNITKFTNGTVGRLGRWLQLEEFASTTHTGTHMDAPSHFFQGAKNVDNIQPSEFFGQAAVIDITSKAELDPDAEATIEDLINWESNTSQSLNGTIVLIRSGWDAKWNNQSSYLGGSDRNSVHFPGLAGSASQWLIENRDIKGAGSDTISLDHGSSFIINDFSSHNAILGHGIYILENVANLHEIPISGADLYVFPIKFGKGSGAPTRIIASVPEFLYNSN